MKCPLKAPPVGAKVTNDNGRVYDVVIVANENSNNVDYPITVIYKDVENGNVWASPLYNFYEKMVLINAS